MSNTLLIAYYISYISCSCEKVPDKKLIKGSRSYIQKECATVGKAQWQAVPFCPPEADKLQEGEPTVKPQAFP